MTQLQDHAEPSVGVTVAEACRQIGIGKKKLYELMASGEIPYTKLPPYTHQAARRIEQPDIDAFKARHRVARTTSL